MMTLSNSLVLFSLVYALLVCYTTATAVSLAGCLCVSVQEQVSAAWRKILNKFVCCWWSFALPVFCCVVSFFLENSLNFYLWYTLCRIFISSILFWMWINWHSFHQSSFIGYWFLCVLCAFLVFLHKKNLWEVIFCGKIDGHWFGIDYCLFAYGRLII